MSRLLLAVALAGIMTAPALAQRDAGAKARGDFFFYARSGYSHVNAAHAHASHYYGYLRSTPTISPRIAGMSDTTLTHHLDMARQHLDGMREYFEATDDADSLATLDETSTHLTAAQEHHAAAQQAAKATPDKPQAVRESIDAMQDSLDKVLAGQETLIKKHDLEEQTLPPSE